MSGMHATSSFRIGLTPELAEEFTVVLSGGAEESINT
jgi:hypothetical protein